MGATVSAVEQRHWNARWHTFGLHTGLNTLASGGMGDSDVGDGFVLPCNFPRPESQTLPGTKRLAAIDRQIMAMALAMAMGNL